MTIFDIDNDIRDLLDKMNTVMEEEGSIPDELVSELSSLKEEREKKLEGIALYWKELKAEADAIKVEADKLAKRAESAKNKADRMKEFLYMMMYDEDAIEQEKVKTNRVSVYFTPSDSVMIENDDWRKVPEEYVNVVTDYKIDKKAIKAVLKEGKEVKGASLKTNYNIQIK